MSHIHGETTRQDTQRNTLRGVATVTGKYAWRWRRYWALILGALFLAAGAQGQGVFATPQPVNVMSGEQGVTVTAQAAGAVKTVQVLTLGAPGLDYAAGAGVSTCAAATLIVGGTCTESITFTPANPGPRIGAVVLLDNSGNVLGATYLSGTGLGGLGVLVPGNVVPVAGNGNYLGSVLDGNPPTAAELYLPSSVTQDGAGNLYIADTAHNRIRKVSASTGKISTIAGNGNPTYKGDSGLAVNATLSSPGGITLDGAGNLYIADTGNNAIRMITAATGVITTIAGNGTQGYAGDGLPATSPSVEFSQPEGVTLDGNLNVYIADTANHRIRMIAAATGVISTIAGDGTTDPKTGVGGFKGDNGPATAAELNFPYTVAFDASGNMYIPDSANNRVRVVAAVNGAITPGSVISTFAGTGAASYSGDGGAATKGTLWAPSALAVDAAGNVFIADTQNSAIRKVSPATGFISTVVKNAIGTFYYGKAFNKVAFYGPTGLYLDGTGNLYIADTLDMVVREIKGNYAPLSFTIATRQGSKSSPKYQTVENDGNAAFDLTAITPDANSYIEEDGTTCTTGVPFLAVDTSCTIAAVFAPTVSGNPLIANINVGSLGDTINSPLDIQLIGVATAVNSTTINVASSLNPSGFGQNVTFTATVTTGAGTSNLTGTVSFFDGATTLASGIALGTPGTTATATFQISTLAVGRHSITATYSGDTTHFASNSTDNSTSPLTQTVMEATTTSLASSVNPSALGQSVTFTATVGILGGGGMTPDGSVTFYDGGTYLAIVPLIQNGLSGTASYSTAALTQGIHSITAVYSEDIPNEIVGSTSTVLIQKVQAAATIAVASSLNPSNYGNPVTFTATITPGGASAATGSVNFFDGATKIGTGVLVGLTNQASYTTSTLIVGSHSITAIYAGDNSNGAATSAAITQTVNKTQTSTTVRAAPNPGIAGAPVAISATVKVVTGSATTTGAVTFTDTFNGSTVTLNGGAVQLVSGAATINPVLTPGLHSIVATYAGDSNDDVSTSAALPLTINQATTQTVVTATPNPALVGATVTFTAKVTGNGGTPSGTITFSANGTQIGTPATVDGTGSATITSSTLAAGSYTVLATYSGDANDLGSTGTGSPQLIVGKIPTVTDLGSSTTTGANPQVILVAAVLGASGPVPTGTVVFNNGATQVGAATLDSSGVATLTPNLPTGTYSIVAVYSGDSVHTGSTSQPTTISGTGSSFDLTVTPAAVSIKSSQNMTITVKLASNNGFADTIGLGCASLPAGVTCHFSPISVPLKADSTATDQLTIDTNVPISGGASAMNKPTGNQGTYLAGLLFPFSLFFGWTLWRFRMRHARVITMVLVMVVSAAALLATGCSGFTLSSAPAGTYVIQVTGAGVNSNVIHYQNITLTITK